MSICHHNVGVKSPRSASDLCVNPFRSKLEGRTGGTAEGVAIGPGRSGSGSHSNDSGVALLLERAHQAFTADHTPSPTPTNHRASDQVVPSVGKRKDGSLQVSV